MVRAGNTFLRNGFLRLSGPRAIFLFGTSPGGSDLWVVQTEPQQVAVRMFYFDGGGARLSIAWKQPDQLATCGFERSRPWARQAEESQGNTFYRTLVPEWCPTPLLKTGSSRCWQHRCQLLQSRCEWAVEEAVEVQSQCWPSDGELGWIDAVTCSPLRPPDTPTWTGGCQGMGDKGLDLVAVRTLCVITYTGSCRMVVDDLLLNALGMLPETWMQLVHNRTASCKEAGRRTPLGYLNYRFSCE